LLVWSEMKISNVTIISIIAAAGVAIVVVWYIRSKQKFVPNVEGVEDTQQKCEDMCFSNQYYDACMQSCIQGDSYIGEDFNRTYFGDEVSPYRYETPGK
jgi:hypothetical protein